MSYVKIHDVLPDVIELYKRQLIFPVSPGKVIGDSNYQFCAAACLAFVGLKAKFGLSKAENFAKDSCNSASSKSIMAAFEELGWDVAIAREKLIVNDRHGESERKEKVLQSFIEMLDMQVSA